MLGKNFKEMESRKNVVLRNKEITRFINLLFRSQQRLIILHQF